jgi:hypothetical protein
MRERDLMGRKYDKYVKAVEAENQAKADLAAAQGGSSRAGMDSAFNKLYDANIDTQEAWDKVMDDPTG